MGLGQRAMKSGRSLIVRLVLPALVTALLVVSCRDEKPHAPVAVARQPKIAPDYAGIVIPPNIAPLNFTIDEPGDRYVARIHSTSGEPIEVVGRTGEILIPPARWKGLLGANAGQELRVDVYVRTGAGKWSQYETITNTIAPEAIDSHLVYRFMMPSSYFPKQMRICQRNLENFEEQTLLDTESFGKGCANCHSFVGNRPDQMLLGIRSTSFPSATAYVHDGRIEKIGAKFGYTAWHPSGKLAVYSINDVRQFFHTTRPEIHDVIDLDSLIVYYDLAKNQTKTAPALSDKKRLETYPAWSPDGKYLYFCSAPLLWEASETVPPKRYQEVRYDLMRIGYDIETDTWGTLETVLSAARTGQSILLPRISPDGRFLLFCLCQYGCFPVYQPTSDLYLMDVQTGQYRKASANSEYSESWHSWSSNSRWIVFSSKRQGGLFTRPYLSYVDANGETHKPFVLPQEHPSFYESCYSVYSVPELIAGPVAVDSEALLQTIVSPTQIGVNSVTGATPKTNSTEAYKKGRPSVQ
jgi:hypothetical protein